MAKDAGASVEGRLAAQHICQTANYTDGPCEECAKEKSTFLDAKRDLREWVLERFENCLRIAETKTGEDKAGWLDDADYFRAVIALILVDEIGRASCRERV